MLGTNVRGRPVVLLVIARLLICACLLKAFGFDNSDATVDDVAYEEFEDSIAAQFVPQVFFLPCTEDPYLSPICMSDGESSDGEVSEPDVLPSACATCNKRFPHDQPMQCMNAECPDFYLMKVINGARSCLYVHVSVCFFVSLCSQ